MLIGIKKYWLEVGRKNFTAQAWLSYEDTAKWTMIIQRLYMIVCFRLGDREFWQTVHFLSVENDSSESEYVKYMQGAIIENLFGEVEFISGYIYIYIFFF